MVLPPNFCNQPNLFGFTELDNKCQFFGDDTLLEQWFGWLIIVGFAALFTAFTSAAIFMDHKFGGTQTTSEQFATAGRSINSGLVACDIVSKWTWAATLLQSSNVAYKFGVSGPFWYASGATIQVILFAILAIEIKRKAPTAHTVLEIVRARWGTTAHIVFFFFAICTNLIVTAMLILGGASVMNALTGVNLYAAAFVIPVGVMFYTSYGGIKAIYISNWVNVTVIYIALLTFMFLVYGGGSDKVGSIGDVWENLRIVSKKYPVPNNKGGSLLTMMSESGFIFGVINVIGNFGTVFVDQSYWQGAIAAKPDATYKGYLLGGLCWFSIPFTMATTMGLAARALGLPITVAESNSGLVPPAVAVTLMGTGGGFLMVLQLWVAVTSTGAAEQMAVATLVAFDVYRTYINKKATGKQIIMVTRIMVVVYAILSGVLAVVLFKIGLNLGWVYLFMGICIGSAVMPIAFSITWAKASAAGAIGGAVSGLAAAVITWMVTCKSLYGEITIDNLGMDYPMLAGNLVAIIFSGIVCVIISLISPQNYDWEKMKEIGTMEKDVLLQYEESDHAAMDRALKWTYMTAGTLAVVLVVVWPLLALPAGVFSKSYFTFWVILSMAWGMAAALCCVLLPLWEGMGGIMMVMKNMVSCTTFEDKGDMSEKSHHFSDPSMHPNNIKS